MPTSPTHKQVMTDSLAQEAPFDAHPDDGKQKASSPPHAHLRSPVMQAWKWEEVEIDIGWGTLRGKACGDGTQQVLGLHGWLDNANTFDLIAPHLPANVRFLSLDLPGHGRSDHFPPGFIYDPRGYMGAVKKAVTVLGWNHFILMGHSMGAVVGIMYTSTFPEDVESFISIDIIKPWSHPPEKHGPKLKKYYLQYFDNEQKSSQPPLVYEESILIKKTMEGSNSLDNRGARIMLQRGSRRSDDGKGLILTRDLRVKAFFVGFIPMDAWMEFARSIQCPLLIIKATEGHHYESPEIYSAMLSSFKENCKNFCYHEMSGKHHIHLTHADTVAKYILDFLKDNKLNSANGAAGKDS